MRVSIFLIIIILPSIVFCKTIDISSNWQFKCIGDKQWKNISLPYKITNIFTINKCIFKKKIHLNNPQKNSLAFILGSVKTSCKIYFNNKLITQIGTFNDNLIEGSKKVIFLLIPGKIIHIENEILIKVISSDINLGLYKGPFLMGNFKEIFIKANKLENKVKYFELFALGILFIITSFCIFTYLNGLREKEYLFLGIFVFAYMIYLLFTSLFLYEIELKIPFLQKIGISIFLILPALIIIFFSRTLGLKISKVINFLNYVLFIFAIVFLILPNSLELITLLKCIWLSIALIYVLRVFFLCFRELYVYELPEFKPIIFGLIILCIGGLNDLFGFTNIEYLNISFLIFILFLTYALTMRFSRINNELINFSGKLIKVRDEEKKKLGRELHDGLGQILVALKLNLQMFFDDKKIINEVVLAISELKNICDQLRPAILENMGFISAVNYFLKKYSKNIKYHLKIDKNIELSPFVEENLFRIFQECLNNAVKHSKATEIKIEFTQDKKNIFFKFQDNGIGFNEIKIRSKGLGLLSIKERCAMIKAQLKMDSKIGEGTIIIVIIPKNNNNAIN